MRWLKTVAEALRSATLRLLHVHRTAVLWLSGYREATVGRGMSMTAEAGDHESAVDAHLYVDRSLESFLFLLHSVHIFRDTPITQSHQTWQINHFGLTAKQSLSLALAAASARHTLSSLLLAVPTSS
jgi:hypothetical protein